MYVNAISKSKSVSSKDSLNELFSFIKLIKNPSSIWPSLPISCLVKNKNGQINSCIDFHNLNKAYPKDEFLLPNIDMWVDATDGHLMFPFMDGFNAYSQIKIGPYDVENSAFQTPMGNFHHTVMPFGLNNAGATYQRTMANIFMICSLSVLKTMLILSSKISGSQSIHRKSFLDVGNTT